MSPCFSRVTLLLAADSLWTFAVTVSQFVEMLYQTPRDHSTQQFNDRPSQKHTSGYKKWRLRKPQKEGGSYGHFDAKTRVAIGKNYSKTHRPINESTVCYIKKAYLEEQSRKRRAENDTVVASLPTKKWGRPLLLGDGLDSKVQAYAKKIKEGGESVSARVMQAAARGIVLKATHVYCLNMGSH